MILSEMVEHGKYCVIGIPDDQGVSNVGGRVGASLGPDAFRTQWKKLKGRYPIVQSCTDLGDVGPLSKDVSKNHRSVIRELSKSLSGFKRSVIVGGGHDHGYTHLRSLKTATGSKKVGCINIDAHLDMRKPNPEITSGSPFYLAIEDGTLSPHHLVEFGIQDQANSPELFSYAKQNKVKIVDFRLCRNGRGPKLFKQALTTLALKCDVIAVSFDLDALSSSFCPGVSAPQAEGFTSSDIIEMMEIAGAHKKVASLGIFELNPKFDLEEKTSKLAATAAYHFIAADFRAS